MIVCPNTSPLLVLGRLDRLEFLGEPADLILTRAVLAEVRDKRDPSTERVDELAKASCEVAPLIPPAVDPLHHLGAGERSVIAWALSNQGQTLCVLDDAAARFEARRLGLSYTGTLGLILRAKHRHLIDVAAPIVAEALAAGLYLDDSVIALALAQTGEQWVR